MPEPSSFTLHYTYLVFPLKLSLSMGRLGRLQGADFLNGDNILRGERNLYYRFAMTTMLKKNFSKLAKT